MVNEIILTAGRFRMALPDDVKRTVPLAGLGRGNELGVLTQRVKARPAVQR